MSTRRNVRVIQLSLVFGLCLAACQPLAELPTTIPHPTPTTVVPATATQPSAPTPTAVSQPAPQFDDWQTYHSAAGGYTIQYPPGWTMTEQTGENGAVSTVFTAPDGNAKLQVAVQPTVVDSFDALDLPNQRCQTISLGQWSGLQCLDTVAASTSVTLLINHFSYSLTSFGKRRDAALYHRFLEGFSLTH